MRPCVYPELPNGALRRTRGSAAKQIKDRPRESSRPLPVPQGTSLLARLRRQAYTSFGGGNFCGKEKQICNPAGQLPVPSSVASKQLLNGLCRRVTTRLVGGTRPSLFARDRNQLIWGVTTAVVCWLHGHFSRNPTFELFKRFLCRKMYLFPVSVQKSACFVYALKIGHLDRILLDSPSTALFGGYLWPAR